MTAPFGSSVGYVAAHTYRAVVNKPAKPQPEVMRGEPVVHMRVSPLGHRVEAFVAFNALDPDAKGKVVDVTRVDFAHGDKSLRVQQFPKPIIHAKWLGLGAPLGWRRTEMVPAHVKAALVSEGKRLVHHLNKTQLRAVIMALDSIGLDGIDIVTRPSAHNPVFLDSFLPKQNGAIARAEHVPSRPGAAVAKIPAARIPAVVTAR